MTGIGLWEAGLGWFEAQLGFTVTLEQKRWAALIHAAAAVLAIVIWIVHVYAAIWVRGTIPIADDVATLGLDMLLAEEGWKRGAHNPFLLGY